MTHNDGKYYAYLSVTDDNTQKGESGNPVKTLRLRYDAWKKAGDHDRRARAEPLQRAMTTEICR